jgi:hypothetical protein
MEKFCATLVCVIADLIMHCSGSASWAASESAVGKCWTAASKLVGFPNSGLLISFSGLFFCRKWSRECTARLGLCTVAVRGHGSRFCFRSFGLRILGFEDSLLGCAVLPGWQPSGLAVYDSSF